MKRIRLFVVTVFVFGIISCGVVQETLKMSDVLDVVNSDAHVAAGVKCAAECLNCHVNGTDGIN